MKWVKHLSANGFVVYAHDVQNMDEIKRTMNVPKALESCHTAVVDRYVIEGHVPADVIKKFLAEKPSALGLAVPECRSVRRAWKARGPSGTTFWRSSVTERRACTPSAEIPPTSLTNHWRASFLPARTARLDFVRQASAAFFL